MRRISFALAILTLVIARPVRAEDEFTGGSARVMLRPFVGAYLPTGAQHSTLSSALLAGAQVGYRLPAPFQLVGSFGWTPSRDRGFADARTNIYQFDAGLEVGGVHSGEQYTAFAPFVGLGAGARTYSLSHPASTSETDPAGYASIGAATRAGPVGLRLELRDYLSRFRTIGGVTTGSSTRNDLMAALGLTMRL
jgi:hypothetical protein